MEDKKKNYKIINDFFKLAKEIDKFESCKTIYDLFKITDRKDSSVIESNISAFYNEYYNLADIAKWKPLCGMLTLQLATIKNVLTIDQNGYNEYLRTTHPSYNPLKKRIHDAANEGKISQEDYYRIKNEVAAYFTLTTDQEDSYPDHVLKELDIEVIKPTEKETEDINKSNKQTDNNNEPNEDGFFDKAAKIFRTPNDTVNSNKQPADTDELDAETITGLIFILTLIFGFIGYFITGPKIQFVLAYSAGVLFLFYFINFYLIPKEDEVPTTQDKGPLPNFLILTFAIILFAVITNNYLYEFPKLTGYLIAAFTTFVLEYVIYAIISTPSIKRKHGTKAFLLISIMLNLFLYLFISIFSTYQNSTEISSNPSTDHSKPAIINDHAPHNLATTNLKLVEYIRSRPKNIGRTYGGGHKKIYYYLRFDGAVPGKTLFEVLWYKDGAILKHENFIPNTVKGYISSSALFNYTPGHYQIGLIVDNNKTLRNTASFNVNNPTPIQVRHIKPNRPAAKPPIPTVIPKPTNHNKEQDDNVIDIIKFKTSKDTTATKMRTIK
jgi:hypothetical protein